MPQPTQYDVHTDVMLTNISVAHLQADDNFVAGKVFPSVPVTRESDKYRTYSQADFYRDDVKKRADMTESAGTGYSLSEDSYVCDVWSLHTEVGDRMRKNADPVLNPDADAARFLTQQMLIRMEREFATNYMATSVWDDDVDPTTAWNAANSTPIEDVQTGQTTILGNTGYEPRTGVTSYDVWAVLRNHPDIVDRYKHTSAASITPMMVAQVLNLDNLYISKAVYNTANEGQTASYSPIATANFLLCYSPPAASTFMPASGYTFSYSGFSDLGTPTAISTLRDPKRKGDRIEIESAWDMKVVSSAMGYFLNGLLS